MKTSIEGKIALITGGNKGYGVGIAQAFKERGAVVWITGRDQEAVGSSIRAYASKA